MGLFFPCGCDLLQEILDWDDLFLHGVKNRFPLLILKGCLHHCGLQIGLKYFDPTAIRIDEILELLQVFVEDVALNFEFFVNDNESVAYVKVGGCEGPKFVFLLVIVELKLIHLFCLLPQIQLDRIERVLREELKRVQS